jgi:hypothetical protein
MSQNTDVFGVSLQSGDLGLFCECLGGFAACGLLRETTPNHPPSPDQKECLGGFAACGLLRKTTSNHPPFVDQKGCYGAVLK